MQPTAFRKRRLNLGISQFKLARLLGISSAQLSSWELGKVQPSADEEHRLIKKLTELEEDPVWLSRIQRKTRFKKHPLNGQTPANRKLVCAIRPVVSTDAPDVDPLPDSDLMPLLRQTRAGNRRRSLALFAGCGGFALGIENAGFEIVGYVELDRAARYTFSRNFPRAACLATDIRTASNETLSRWRDAGGELDLIFGGPPCQGFSLAGKRDPDDLRNYLYTEFARFARILQPKLILMENVRLMTSMKSRSDSYMPDEVCRALGEAGYECQWRELNARDYGVPQFRERVFFLGVRNNSGNLSPSFPPPTHGGSAPDFFTPARLPFRTFRDATWDLEPLEAGEASATDPWHWAVNHPPHVLAMLHGVPEGKSAHDNPDPRLRPPSGYNTTYKRLRWDEPSSTIGTTFGMISASRNVHPLHTRSLTVREAMRCQTLPDTFQLFGSLGDIRRMIGNAVPPLLAQRLSEHLLALLSNHATGARAVREAC